ncbi:winged helix-turn-helix domain-containing protein [Streptosporangium sp. NPDC048047]|uniref:winged helix-turn-helix domain-containing protein n=1 Tax=Streptosporangium sp. NPDC048047 TaxID=3155748 RepID=UPI00343DF619
MVKNTGRPGYLQIADDLREQIRTGALAPGAPLPSTTRLAERYEASLSVVKLAVGVLRNEGLVIGQQGKGVFVREGAAPAPLEASSDELTEIRATLQDLSERLARVESALTDRQ